MLKHFGIGFLLCFQFFSVIPIQKELPLNRKTISMMYIWLPMLSIFTGGIAISLLYVNENFFYFSPLLTAVVLVIVMIVATGGLHMDGLIDTGDAFFSYRDLTKRMEILDDPRVGAFGVLTVVCTMLLKIGILYEVLLREIPFIYFFIVPFIARIGMLLYFVTMDCAKTTGLAAYFKNQVEPNKIKGAIIFYLLLLFVGSIIAHMVFEIAVLIVVLLVVGVYYRYWSKRQFGGMTGDLLGAFYEGMDVLLWGIVVLLFI